MFVFLMLIFKQLPLFQHGFPGLMGTFSCLRSLSPSELVCQQYLLFISCLTVAHIIKWGKKPYWMMPSGGNQKGLYKRKCRREKKEEKNKGQWRTEQWINSGSKGGEILPPCSDDDKRKLTIFCHGSLVQTHPWNWWEFNGLESTLSLMYFLAHRSQLKLNSAFCKIKLDTLVCYSESLILVGRSWAKLLKEKKKQIMHMELFLWQFVKLLS